LEAIFRYVGPAFEPECSAVKKIFELHSAPSRKKLSLRFAKFNHVNSVAPDDAYHMWHAALQGNRTL